MLNVPAVIGVPVSAPAEESDKPGGTASACHEYGGTPPVAETATEYADPTVAPGNVVSEIVSVGVTVKGSATDCVAPFRTTTVAVPGSASKDAGSVTRI